MKGHIRDSAVKESFYVDKDVETPSLRLQQEEGDVFANRLKTKSTIPGDQVVDHSRLNPPLPKAAAKAVAKPKAKAKAKFRGRGDLDRAVPGAGPRGGNPSLRNPEESQDAGVSEPRVGKPPEEKEGEPEKNATGAKKVLANVHDKLRDKVELLQEHQKHYHLSLANFKSRN